jgi:hypothetical protein
MRLPLCALVLVVCACGADPAAPIGADAAHQSDTAQQSSAPAQPAAAPAPAAQAPAATPAPPPKYGGWVFSGMADGYFSDNFDHPQATHNQLQNFDVNYGQPELSLVKFTVDKSDSVIGIHVDAGFGETMRWIHAADPAAIDHQAFRYIEQMYAIAKPKNWHGTEIDFGEFVTSAGAEVIEANSNWNYTRSLLFGWAIPYYHFGLRTSTPITKEITVGFQLVNAWNTLWGNNNMDNVGFMFALAKPKYTWNVTYYEGPNHMGTTQGKRNLFDTTVLLTPTSKWNMYINGDIGRDNNIGPGHSSWYGIAGAARFQATKKFAFAARAEVFDDVNGFSTGLKQVLREGTITGEYKYNDHFIGRVEYRRDNSTQPFFNRGLQEGVAHTMDTFTIGLMAIFGPMK